MNTLAGEIMFRDAVKALRRTARCISTGAHLVIARDHHGYLPNIGRTPVPA
jgi:hypothetical protein